MNRRCLILLIAAVLLLPVGALHAQDMGTSGGYDLDQLWDRARQQFDPDGQDAIVLLEARRIDVLAVDYVRIRVRRVVWIGTAVGIRGYADLRIPWNSATSTLTVTTLRTWRDGAWWPDEQFVSPTAVVETVPYAVAQADEYTSMRETMLLHDGVELPCIVETAYEIEERVSGGHGTDELWVFAQRDPAALVEYVVTVPARASLSFHSGNGAPDPTVTSGGDRTAFYSWAMENVGPLGTPLVSNPAGYKPYVVWSTWNNWSALGRKIVSSFDGAAVAGNALSDTLDARLKHEPSAASRARAVAAYVDESTRSIHYDSQFWMFSPRPAARTWETAYGHGLDRAVLAAALFRRAGLDAQPVFRSAGPGGGINQEVPGLSGFRSVEVWVQGDGFRALYDPAAGTLSDRPQPLYGRVMWRPGVEEAPDMGTGGGGDAADSRFELLLTLEPCEKDGWIGTGYFRADGVFSPHGDMAGLEGEALEVIRKVAASVLPGAKVNNYNPELFERGRVAVGFDLTVGTGDPDGHGRTEITAGKPVGGIADHLPADVHLYNERRGSPVLLPGVMTQRVRIRLKTGGREVAQLPEAVELVNGTGRYTVSADHTGGWVVVERTLTLNAGTVAPASWTELRTLLLEEDDYIGRTVLLK
jgi:hypothetical protein